MIFLVYILIVSVNFYDVIGICKTERKPVLLISGAAI